MIPKPIGQISKTDIEGLISARTGERKNLDYKLLLPGGRDEEKREFLYDVSSFANAEGGDLIFGIADERDSAGKATGIPASAQGLQIQNLSSETLRLENLIRDGIAPRIPGIEWQTIDGFPDGPVVIMRIPKSWSGPHMVIFSGLSRFYSRNSAGKYRLDVGEIRSAFLASSATGENLHRFRLERIAKAMEDDLPVSLGEGVKILFHLIPLAALDTTNLRDVAKLAAKHFVTLHPMSAGSWSHRYNLDGLLTFSNGVHSYVQVFRSGVIEAGEGELFKWTNERKIIPSTALEETLLKACSRYLDVQKELSIPLPIAAMLTLIGLKGFTMSVPHRYIPFVDGQHIVDRDILTLPEIMIESYDVPTHIALQPVFDSLWQASGFERSLNYDNNGEWKPRE